MTEQSRKTQFMDALKHMQIMSEKAVVRVEDVNYLIDACYKLLMNFDDMEKSRANWRKRAEEAEAKLKL